MLTSHACTLIIEKNPAKCFFWFHSVQVKTITLSMLKTSTDHLNGDEEVGGGGGGVGKTCLYCIFFIVDKLYMLIIVNFFTVNMHCLKDNATSSLLNNFIFSFFAKANLVDNISTQPPSNTPDVSQGTPGKWRLYFSRYKKEDHVTSGLNNNYYSS